MKRFRIHSLLTCVLFFACGGSTKADEGMYPISELGNVNLKAAGILLSAQDIFNPADVGLVNAIVNVGGCTGSFVSSDGLILTNHHCAFGYLQAASTVEHDYLTAGFFARSLEEEIPARGGSVRITESYRDVSRDVLSAVSDTMSPGERTRAIAARSRKIVADAEKERPGTRAEVAEMFPGKSYVLFLYTYLRDLRIVYAPPRSIGEFGGETDNWVWPRHTGDFSFLRAYVGPDGSPAAYSRANVPYHPEKFLKVQPKGVGPEDPVFVLGYPGRTYRHRTSHYLDYEQKIRMPYVAALYDWEIAAMEDAGRKDRSVALKLDARIKRLANTSKNYWGKLQGLERLDLVQTRRAQEARLQEFIDADPGRKELFGSLLNEIAAVYEAAAHTAGTEAALDQLGSGSILVSSASFVLSSARERAKPDLQRAPDYSDRNYERTKDRLFLSLQNYDHAIERRFLTELLQRAARLYPDHRVPELELFLQGGDREQAARSLADTAVRRSLMADSATVRRLLADPPDSATIHRDPVLRLVNALEPAYSRLREAREQREGELTRLFGRYVEVKMLFDGKKFIPDANGTLRMTYGKIRGYAPADAVYYNPITTLRGVVEKTTGQEPFTSPRELLELYRKKDFGRFASPELRSVPVALLYNLDTTGGNSGSPLLNGRGELVGVNFDRAYEATINDFAWSEAYSRSIAVDIRYVLWVTEKIGGATRILKEMGL